MPSVVITGAAGFLGSHSTAAFEAAGWRVIGANRPDLEQHGRFLSILEREKPDALVHLAAPANVQQSLRDPRGDFDGHIAPAITVFDAVRLSRLPMRVVLISSAAVYGDPQSLPIAEDAPLAPISPYGFHKVQLESLLREYVELHGMRGCIARVFSTYGERQRRLAIWEMTRRALAGQHDVFGTGDETRDYLYAGDVAGALVLLIANAECNGEAINVSSGEEVSMREVAAKVYALAQIDGEPRFTGESMPGSPAHWRADVAKLRALGFAPPSWSRGLAQTIDWIRESE